MLIAVDPSLGTEAAAIVEALASAFKEPVAAFVAPVAPPDAGLEAALVASPPVVVEGSNPPSWLTERAAERVRATRPLEPPTVIDDVARVAALGRKGTPQPHAEQAAPLTAEALTAGLASLPSHWRVDVVPAAAQPLGLKVELVARFRCADYLTAATFARAVADVAEAQDHHPTLVHDWRFVTVRVTTGAAKGRLSERDLRFAAAVDACFSG